MLCSSAKLICNLILRMGYMKYLDLLGWKQYQFLKDDNSIVAMLLFVLLSAGDEQVQG